MAGSVSVDAESIKTGINCCKMVMHELKEASKDLKKSYQQISHGWNDKKFVEFSGIVEECCSSLEDPIAQLEGCIGTLEELLTIVESYDSV
jgi:hypothetical protein